MPGKAFPLAFEAWTDADWSEPSAGFGLFLLHECHHGVPDSHRGGHRGALRLTSNETSGSFGRAVLQSFERKLSAPGAVVRVGS